MRFRGREYGENPAWPGLVDVFAFTMVFFLLLAAGGDESNSKLREENVRLTNEVTQLKQQMAQIIIMGKKQLEDLKRELEKIVNQNEIEIKYHEEVQEIELNGIPEAITFDTAKYELATMDQDRLKRLAQNLVATIQGKDFFILINATADPRPLISSQPPRSNIELSALRAATTAELLEEAAPGISKLLRVVGLGEMGELLTPPPPDPDEAYKKYRKLNLVIKVDTAAMLEKLKSKDKSLGNPGGKANAM